MSSEHSECSAYSECSDEPVNSPNLYFFLNFRVALHFFLIFSHTDYNHLSTFVIPINGTNGLVFLPFS